MMPRKHATLIWKDRLFPLELWPLFLSSERDHCLFHSSGGRETCLCFDRELFCFDPIPTAVGYNNKSKLRSSQTSITHGSQSSHQWWVRLKKPNANFRIWGNGKRLCSKHSLGQELPYRHKRRNAHLSTPPVVCTFNLIASFVRKFLNPFSPSQAFSHRSTFYLLSFAIAVATHQRPWTPRTRCTWAPIADSPPTINHHVKWPGLVV